MKTIIIGAGVSGVTAAIAIKRNNPKEDVLIIEHLDKPLKKVLATGNGKCNLTNINIKTLNYKNAGFVKQIIKKDYYEILLNFFESIGFKIKLNGDLIYPMSESAITVRDCLLLECRHLGIKINVEESLIDYKSKQNGYNVTTNKTKYDVDRLIFATGGKSTPKLGSTGDIISILERHNYQFETMMP
jgi:predicted Rossmann fold flavoprotein